VAKPNPNARRPLGILLSLLIVVAGLVAVPGPLPEATASDYELAGLVVNDSGRRESVEIRVDVDPVPDAATSAQMRALIYLDGSETPVPTTAYSNGDTGVIDGTARFPVSAVGAHDFEIRLKLGSEVIDTIGGSFVHEPPVAALAIRQQYGWNDYPGGWVGRPGPLKFQMLGTVRDRIWIDLYLDEGAEPVYTGEAVNPLGTRFTLQYPTSGLSIGEHSYRLVPYTENHLIADLFDYPETTGTFTIAEGEIEITGIPQGYAGGLTGTFSGRVWPRVSDPGSLGGGGVDVRIFVDDAAEPLMDFNISQTSGNEDPYYSWNWVNDWFRTLPAGFHTLRTEAVYRDLPDGIEPMVLASRTDLFRILDINRPSGLPMRLSGADRYATAAAIAGVWDEMHMETDVVFVATGENYPDALAAAAAAAHFGAPVLLTPKNSLPSVVKSRLNQIAPDRIIVLGSSAAISNGVVTALKSVTGSPQLIRWAGSDRYATMREIVKRTFGVNGNGDGMENVNMHSIVIATGTNFPDALSAGPAVASVDGAVILVDGSKSSIPTETLNLLRDLEPQRIVIAGSTAAVKAGIETQLRGAFGSGKVKRIAGADRYATATRITDHFFDGEPPAVFLAVGTNFPDALAGAALAGAVDAPLLIAQKSCVPGGTAQLILAFDYPDLVLLGSTAALKESVRGLGYC